MEEYRILIIDDEPLIRWSLKEPIEEDGYSVFLADSMSKAREWLEKESFHLVILDIKLPDGDGLELLEEIKEREKDTLVIMITAYGSIDTAVNAMKKGAYDFITKPFDIEHVRILVRKAFETSGLRKELAIFREKDRKALSDFRIISKSKAMKEVFFFISKVADSSTTTVLLMGESGVGKDLLARAIHFQSRRASEPFMEVNCAALPETLIESELFGHERGAFTDAKEQKKGYFEVSGYGTVFLDEISEMSLATQAKFLRAIDAKCFKRLGGVRDIPIKARIIAASNRDLKKEVKGGRFREDLYYRLMVLPIYVPPLKERKEDIPLLIRHFIEMYNVEFRKKCRGITPDALDSMMDYDWPGNVRELRNVIERMIILEEGDILTKRFLPSELISGGEGGAAPKSRDAGEGGSRKGLAEIEKDLIIRALEESGYNQTKAAELLSISRPTLRYRMKKYGISRGQPQDGDV